MEDEDADNFSTPRADIAVWKHLMRKEFIKAPKEFHRGHNITEYRYTSNHGALAGEDDRRYNLDDLCSIAWMMM